MRWERAMERREMGEAVHIRTGTGRETDDDHEERRTDGTPRGETEKERERRRTREDGPLGYIHTYIHTHRSGARAGFARDTRRSR